MAVREGSAGAGAQLGWSAHAVAAHTHTGYADGEEGWWQSAKAYNTLIGYQRHRRDMHADESPMEEQLITEEVLDEFIQASGVDATLARRCLLGKRNYSFPLAGALAL